MLTEDEAKTKWCPQYRDTASGHDIANADNRPPEQVIDHGNWQATGKMAPRARCLGSACMAWRWASDKDGESAYRETKVRGVANEYSHIEYAPLGFCGLAGKP